MIFTEYDPLEEIIVADTYLPGDADALFPGRDLSSFNRILEETKQDFDGLANYLSAGGIKVHRPQVHKFSQAVAMPGFDVNFPMSPVVPRDQYKVQGNTILQTYTSMPDRYFDSISYYNIFQNMFEQGYNWISQPPPGLQNLGVQDAWYASAGQIYKGRLADKLLWHTATMFSVGDAVIINDQGPGTNLGLEWIKRNLPDYNFVHNHSTSMRNFGHIDHGFFMIDDETVIHGGLQWVPQVLRDKHLIDVSEHVSEIKLDKYLKDYLVTKGKNDLDWMDKYLENWRGYVQEVCFDLNVLVIDRHNVVFARELPDLFRLLESHQIECHVCPQRHMLYWEGGVHCATLDVKRHGRKRSIIQSTGL